jgi:hypothetical protein
MNLLYKAAIGHFEAKRDEAIATLEVYLNKAVGIGEHSELLEEITKWSERLANANDSLEALRNSFDQNGAPKPWASPPSQR